MNLLSGLIALGLIASTSATETKEVKVKTSSEITIPGVPTLGWGKTGDCTYAGALEAALSVTKHPVTYTEVMGFSGLAFRVRWRGNENLGWCPSIPVGEFPEEIERTAFGTGWKLSSINEMANEKDPHMERYRDRIKASIDKKIPVVGYPKTDDLNVGVCYGYTGQGDSLSFLWHGFFSGDQPVVVADDKVGPWVLIPTEFSDKTPKAERVRKALENAVSNWKKTNSVKDTVPYTYTYGAEALDLWIKDLTSCSSLPDDKQRALFFLNWWNLEGLADARKHAGAFLTECAKSLPVERQAVLSTAIAAFKEESDLLTSAFVNNDLFQGPWKNKKFEDWSADVRKNEISVLQKAKVLESKGMEAVGLALKGK